MRVVFDIDGTIANNAHREVHAIAKDWDKFHSLCHLDPPIGPTLEILHALSNDRHIIEIWTARPDTYLKETCEWLHVNGIEHDVLMMRAAGDWRRAYILKLEWYLQRSPKQRPALVFEDHPETVRLLRAAGAIVHQVADRDHH